MVTVEHYLESADRARARLERGHHEPAVFREELLAVAPSARDAWVDRALGLGDIPDDAAALPRDGVPYLPSAVDVLLRTVEQARVTPGDVFVDVGAGVGRAALLVHLLTGAEAIGVEIQPHLVAMAREVSTRLRLERAAFVEGDASEAAALLARGSVFFLYCPFSGRRLARVLEHLEAVARKRAIRVACVDLPLSDCPWLSPASPGETRPRDLVVHRSIL